MTQHRLIFLKESAGSALSVKLKMLGGEHLNDTVYIQYMLLTTIAVL